MPGSGFAPNDSIASPRNDSVPSKDRAHYPSTIDRSAVTKKDSHYKGDNVRNTFPDNPPPYQTPGERFSGIVDFGLDADIWEYPDNEIRYVVQQQLARKHSLDPRLLDVVVHRHLGKVNYDYRRFLQSDRKNESLADYVDLEEGEDFTWTKDVYDDELGKELKRRVPPEAVWIKDNISKAHVKDDQRDVDYGGKTLTFTKVRHYWMVLRVYERTKKRKPDGMRKVIFDDVIDGEGFIFLEFPQELAKKKLPWDTMFTKVGHGAENKKNNITFEDLPDNMKVYTKEEYEKKGQYQKEDLDDVFDSLIKDYKTIKNKTGVEVAAPRNAVEKAFTQFDIPWAKFNSMSEKQMVYYNDKEQQITKESAQRREKAGQPFEEREIWHGNWGKYAWVMDGNEIRISRRK